jgi:hypothetical protein
MSKTLLTWSEPFLFVSRLRTGQEWLWRLAYVAGITTVAFVLFRVFRGGLPWLTALEISLVIGDSHFAAGLALPAARTLCFE